MKKIILILQVVFIFMTFTNAYSQWQPKIKLTNAGFLHNGRCIAASGNIVHVVWHSIRDGNPEIYYKRSQDGGLSWGADIRLTNNSYDSNEPSIAVSGSVVHVIWNDTRDGNYETYYKRSQDGGLSWGADTRLSDFPSKSHTASIAVSGSVVHVVWEDERHPHHKIYYKRSQDGGISWGADTLLTTNNISDSWHPSVSVSGAFVNVVWIDSRDGPTEIYYKRSQDGGTSWGTDTRLTNIHWNKYNPKISVTGAFVHVVWRDTRDGNNEIYYKRSQDGGTSWGTDTRLTNNIQSSISPSVLVSGSVVHVVWEDARNYYLLEIFYKCSQNGGTSWETDTPLTSGGGGHKYHPSISVSDTVVHVFWRDAGNDYGLYYRNNPSGNPTNSTLIGTEIPEVFKLYQNYPNPFNPTTYIKFDIQKTSATKLIIYDALGREVATLVNEKLSAGSYETSWDGSNYPSGVYFYTLQAGDYIETRKMLLIK